MYVTKSQKVNFCLTGIRTLYIWRSVWVLPCFECMCLRACAFVSVQGHRCIRARLFLFLCLTGLGLLSWSGLWASEARGAFCLRLPSTGVKSMPHRPGFRMCAVQWTCVSRLARQAFHQLSLLLRPEFLKWRHVWNEAWHTVCPWSQHSESGGKRTSV